MTEHDPLDEPPFEPTEPAAAAPVIEHDPEVRPAAVSTPAPARTRSGGTPGWVTLLLFLILAGGIAAAWTNPKPPERDDLVEVTRQVQAEGQTVGGLSAQLQAIGQQMQALSDRVDKLEKAPAQAAPAAPAGAPDLGDLPKRVDDLSAKVAALESQPAASPAPADSGAAQQAVAALSQKLDQVQAADKAALEQVQSADKAALDQLQAQQKDAIAPLDGRVAKLEQGAGSVEDAASRATRLERIQAAVVALQAGQKLGDIPNAPPALAKFANQAPPTEAALRESFPAVAAHARAVSEPDPTHKSFFQRAFARLQESVTVRQGNDVLVGDPAAGVLSDAEIRVQNGDLAGAVSRLGALTGPAAAAVQGWVEQAQSLIAARAALASLAARG